MRFPTWERAVRMEALVLLEPNQASTFSFRFSVLLVGNELNVQVQVLEITDELPVTTFDLNDLDTVGDVYGLRGEGWSSSPLLWLSLSGDPVGE
ncbi:hypothetical protein ACFX13_023114 [Malus domestica]